MNLLQLVAELTTILSHNPEVGTLPVFVYTGDGKRLELDSIDDFAHGRFPKGMTEYRITLIPHYSETYQFEVTYWPDSGIGTARSSEHIENMFVKKSYTMICRSLQEARRLSAHGPAMKTNSDGCFVWRL